MTEPMTQPTPEQDDPPPGSDRASYPPPPKSGLARWIIAAVLVAGVLAGVLWPRGEPDESVKKGGWGGKGKGGHSGPTAVRVAPVVEDLIVVKGRYRGELDADAVDVSADLPGRLTDLSVRMGDHVDAGATLARLDVRDLRRQVEEAQAQARAAVAGSSRIKPQLEAARAELARSQRLAAQGLVSAQQVETQSARVGGLEADLEAAAAGEGQANARLGLLNERIGDARIRAPFAGRIVDRLADPGGYVQPGQGIVRLVAASPLRVRFDVPESDIPFIEVGQPIDVLVPALPEVVRSAKVTGIASEVDRTRRTVLVEGIVEDPPEKWLPGMYVEAAVAHHTYEEATVVPARAVLSRMTAEGEETVGVFRAVDDVARWSAVEVLGRQGERVAVKGPVKAGESVLIRGHGAIDDGAPIQIATEAEAEKAAPDGTVEGAGSK